MKRARHIAAEGPLMTRRTALACALGGLGLLGFAGLIGCRGESSPADAATGSGVPPADGAADGFDVSAHVAHETGVRDGDALYYVAFSSGSIVRCGLDGSGPEVLYSNGHVNHLGIRYLALDGGELFFCDVPTASVRAVPCAGGEARTVWASEDARALPLPVVVAGERLYFSLLDGESMGSELWSVRRDGSDPHAHFSLPANFYVQCVDPERGRAYYAGTDGLDARQIRSAALADGSDELVLFSLDGVPSAASALSWQVAADRLLVEAQDDTQLTNRLLSMALDGSDQQLVHDFSSQKVVFDSWADHLFLVDRETLAVLARTGEGPEGGPHFETVATIPRRAAGSALSLVEADDGLVWVMTVTPGVDNANEYVTHLVDPATGTVTELV